ncbi:MAG TPA: NAD(P)H-dependent glycerol-3-phosphate dehydrogenase [Candidatus Magasanikbacteria bacterium]|nr:NAD(P)H-dependent glycerol-3-phosphate dehydrogenase [Candidatus Magasanikbacteria bacterium]
MKVKTITMQKVAVLGAGNMGTAVAKVLAENGHDVRIWNWEGDKTPLEQIEKYHENKKFMPRVKLPVNIRPAYQIADAVSGASAVFFVVPSGVMEHTVAFAAKSIGKDAIVIDVSKGLSSEMEIIPFAIMKYLRPGQRKNVVSISGPAIAAQMVARQYTAMNIAGGNKKAIARVCALIENDYIRLIPTSDIVGVEIGGSFKNAYAIAMGICDAMGYGLNTKAALLTYAIREIADLIEAAGGRRETAYELAGVGDLIGTALSPDSRNRRFGECLGSGLSGDTAIKKVKQTVEGIEAVRCLMDLANRHHVRVPFATMVFECVNSGRDPRRIMREFLSVLGKKI